MNALARLLACLAASSLTACADTPQHPTEPYDWALPADFAPPAVPADNPMSAAKVALGRRLFYDKRLSRAGTTSCASCHDPTLAFTDSEPSSEGATGQRTPRSSMSLAGVGYVGTLTWANPLLVDLESQSLVPLFGDNPVEIGGGPQDELLGRLLDDPYYRGAFPAAFPDAAEPATLLSITRALAAFQRTIISANSPYDAWTRGDADALPAAAQRGLVLFESSRLGCAHCHSGPHFTDAATDSGPVFHHIGLPPASYQQPNRGVAEVSLRAEDEGLFRTPTLRNIALTAPYMHDGSLATLGDVLDHFASGGSGAPAQSLQIQPFTLNETEREDVLAFLRALTDREFVTSPELADPW
jgi:cytochrome c peroxidase